MTLRVLNPKGHEVKVGDSVLAYHVSRMLDALDFEDSFADVLAVDHATRAAHEALNLRGES